MSYVDCRRVPCLGGHLVSFEWLMSYMGYMKWAWSLDGFEWYGDDTTFFDLTHEDGVFYIAARRGAGGRTGIVCFDNGSEFCWRYI